MISDEYSFEKFLDTIKDKNLPEIQIIASQEAEAAERLSSSSTRGVSKAMKIDIGYYRTRVGEFAFFMGSGIKPGSVDESDFELYQPICEILVKKGQFLPSILNCFKKSD
jgi:hypothetical protein